MLGEWWFNGNKTFCIAMNALEAGWATTAELRRANAWCYENAPKLGEMALKRGKLNVKQTFEILSCQARNGGLFGEIAVHMGLLSEADILELLKQQVHQIPSLADGLLALQVITAEQATLILEQERLQGMQNQLELALPETTR